MREPPGKAVGYFIPDNSPLAADVQRTLTEGSYRCNIMMVSNGDQALAILRQEKRTQGHSEIPHVLLVYGGLADGRAAALVSTLKADPAYAGIRLIVVIGPEHHAQTAAGALALDAFDPARLEPLLAEPDFWWVMAKLG